MKKFNRLGPNILFSVVILILLAQIALRIDLPVVNFVFSDPSGLDESSYPLKIQYIDVGQGDSELISLPNGESVLIDAGETKNAAEVIQALEKFSIDKIDYLIATHPHADHIGGMQTIVENYDIGSIYMPRTDHDSKTYLNLLEAISGKNLKINTVTAGLVMIDEPDIKAEFIAPNNSEYSELNNYSAVLKLVYKDSKFLFMGDAETLSEEEILSAGFDVSADILKAGHHGSKTSTSDEFLQAVSPSCVIISCGLNNSYSHPSEETLEKLGKNNIPVLRTDTMGTITLYSDGYEIKTMTEKG